MDLTPNHTAVRGGYDAPGAPPRPTRHPLMEQPLGRSNTSTIPNDIGDISGDIDMLGSGSQEQQRQQPTEYHRVTEEEEEEEEEEWQWRGDDANKCPVVDQQGESPGWSFRRFGADEQAQVVLDTWDELVRDAPTLLQVMADRERDLLKSEQALRKNKESMTFPPINTPSMTREKARVVARQTRLSAMNLLGKLDRHAVVGSYQRGSSAYTKFQRGDGGNACIQITTDKSLISITMNRQEYDDFRQQLQAFVKGSNQLMTRCDTTISAAVSAREAWGQSNSAVRAFILSVWSEMAQRSRAYPPFFHELGPLDGLIYGIGRTEPGPPGKVPPTTSPLSADTGT